MNKVLIVIAVFSQITFANIVGSDAQNFNPITSGLDFVTVHSSNTLDEGILNFGFYANHAVNTFPFYTIGQGTASQSRTEFNDSLTSTDLNFGYGINDKWEVGLSLPFLIDQSVDDKGELQFGRFENSGLIEVRANTKYRFYRKDGLGLATVISANFNQIKNNPYTGKDAGPTYNLEFVAHKRFPKFDLAANIGYRFRDEGEVITGSGIDPIRDQFIYSFAGSYFVAKLDSKFIFEIVGQLPTQESENFTDRSISSLESLFGVKHDYSANLALSFGGGTELAHGTATPDWRIYAGLNYTIGPLTKEESRYEIVDDVRYMTITFTNIGFEFNSTKINAQDEELLDRVLEKLKRYDNAKEIVVEGHTDSLGDNNYNQILSERRAQMVRDKILRLLDIDFGKVQAIGFGEERPIADNGNYQGRLRNRRVVIRVDKEEVTKRRLDDEDLEDDF